MSERQGQWLEVLLLLILINVSHGWMQVAYFFAWVLSAILWLAMGYEEHKQRKARR